jgi:hypothetical protein
MEVVGQAMHGLVRRKCHSTAREAEYRISPLSGHRIIAVNGRGRTVSGNSKTIC